NVLYDIYIHPVRKTATLERVHVAEAVPDSPIEVCGKFYLVEKRGSDTYNFTYMPDGQNIDATKIYRSYIKFGEHLVDIDGRTYTVEKLLDEAGGETARLTEKDTYVSSVMVSGQGTVKIEGVNYSAQQIAPAGEGTVGTYLFIFDDGLKHREYYTDKWGLLRIEKKAYTLMEIVQYGMPKLRLTRSFSSMPSEGPIRLGGKLYNVTYDYLTGRFVFDDGFDYYQSSDDRSSVTIEGTEYDIERDPETNTVKLSEKSPVETVFESTFGMKTVTLRDGRTYSVSIGKDGRITLATPTIIHVSDKDGRVQVGSDLYIAEETGTGELLFTRVTESEVAEGSLLKIGNSYMAVESDGNAKVDAGDVTALTEIYQRFFELDLNADGLLNESDTKAMMRQLEQKLEDIDDLADSIRNVNDVIREIYSTPIYRKEVIAGVDMNGNGYVDAGDRDIYSENIERYNLMDLNALERITKDIYDNDTETVIYGREYDVSYDDVGEVFTLAKKDGTYTAVITGGDTVVFDEAQISYTASVYTTTVEGEERTALTLTRDTSFTAPVKPVAGGGAVDITVHGIAGQATIDAFGIYHFTFDGKQYTSLMKGMKKKVCINELTFEINDAGAPLILNEENVTDTGVYLTAESVYGMLARLVIEVKADVAGPAGALGSDGVLDIEDVKRLKKDPMDVNGDGIKDNRDIDLVWTIIDYNEGVVNAYDYNPNHKLDEADIDAFEFLVGSGGTGLDLDLNNDGQVDEQDTRFLTQVVTTELFKGNIRNRLDRNYDGIIAEGERAMLEGLFAVSEGDADGNGLITREDLDEFDAIKSMVDGIMGEFGTDSVIAADVNEDYIVNYKDSNLLTEARRSYVNVNGDYTVINNEKADIVDIKDDYILQAIVDPDATGVTSLPLYGLKILDLPQYVLSESVRAKADFDGNTTVNQEDFDLWSQFDLAQIRHEMDASGCLDPLVDFDAEGGKLNTIAKEASFAYTITPQTAGIYRLALAASSSALTVAYFDVYVDGEYRGSFSLGASPTIISESYIDLEFDGDPAEHEVKFEMTNASSRQMTVSIHKLILTEPVPSEYDIDGDYQYTQEDGKVIQRMIRSYSWIIQSDISLDGEVDADDLYLLDINMNGAIDPAEAKFDVINRSGDFTTDGYISQLEARRDVDRNGKVEQADLDMLRSMLDTIDIASRSDVNGDGFINAADLNDLRQSLAVLNSQARLDLTAELVDDISDGFHTVSRSEVAKCDLNGDGIMDSRDLDLATVYIEEGLMDAIIDAEVPLVQAEEIKVGDTIYDGDSIIQMLTTLGDLEVADGGLRKNLLHREGFDSVSLPDWQAGSGDWVVAGSKCSQTGYGAESARMIYKDTPQGDDLILEAQLRITDMDKGSEAYKKGTAGAGVVFRAQDDENYYSLVLNPVLNRVEFRKVVNAGKPAVIAYAKLAAEVREDLWYTLKLRAEGSYYTFYLNGEEIFSVKNTVFESGNAGLFCTTGCKADFDNAVIGSGSTFREMIMNGTLASDLDLDGIIDAWDYAILDALDGLQKNVSAGTLAAMADVSRGDFTGDGRVDEADREFFDIVSDGALDGADAAVVAEVMKMSNEYRKYDMVDVDGDGIVTAKDRKLVDDSLQYMIDINGDGVFDDRDMELFDFIEDELGIDFSDSWNKRADINKDGSIDSRDVEAFEFAEDYQERVAAISLPVFQSILSAIGKPYSDPGSIVKPDDFARADLNKDGRVNSADLTEISGMMAFINNSSDPDLAYAMVDVYKYDINRDTVFSDADVTLLAYIKQRVEEGKVLTSQDFIKYDMDLNGALTEEDYEMAANAVAYYVDVDKNGKVNRKDGEAIEKCILNFSVGVTSNMVKMCDINVSGAINYRDREYLEDAMVVKEAIDLDRDGDLEEEEISTVRYLIGGFVSREIVDGRTVKSVDMNGDGEVDVHDIAVLEGEIASIRTEMLSLQDTITAMPVLMERARAEAMDTNGDGLRTQEDIDHVKEIIEYLAYQASEDITELLVLASDIDQDGRVNWNDMVYMDMHFDETYADIHGLDYYDDFTGTIDPDTDYVELLDLDGDAFITDKDFDEFDDIRYAMSQGDIPDIRQFEKFDLNGDGSVDVKDVNKVKSAYTGRVDIDGDYIINDLPSEQGGPSDGMTDKSLLDDFVLMQGIIDQMNALTDVSDPLSVIQVILNEDLAKNRQAGLNRFLKAADLDGSGDGKITQDDLEVLGVAIGTRDNPYFDINTDGTFNNQDVFLIHEIMTEINSFQIHERPYILEDVPCVYARTILQPDEFHRRDITNDLVIDQDDLDDMRDARSRMMSFSEDQLVRKEDVAKLSRFRSLNIPIYLEDLYRGNYVTANDLADGSPRIGSLTGGLYPYPDYKGGQQYWDEDAGDWSTDNKEGMAEWGGDGYVIRTYNLRFGADYPPLRPRIQNDLYSHTEETVGDPPPIPSPAQPGYENIFHMTGFGPYLTEWQYDMPETDEYGRPLYLEDWYGYPIVMNVKDDIQPSDISGDGLVNNADLFYIEQAIRNIALGEFAALGHLIMADLDMDSAFTGDDIADLQLVMEHAVDVNGDRMISEDDIDLVISNKEKIIEAKKVNSELSRIDSLLDKLDQGGSLAGEDIGAMEGTIDYLGLHTLEGNVAGSFDMKIETIKSILEDEIFTGTTPEATQKAILREMVDELGIIPARAPDYAGTDFTQDQQSYLNDALLELFTFEQMDIDGDEAITQEELLRALSGIFKFEQLDRDGDGLVSENELNDMKQLIRDVMEVSTISSDELERADINRDGVVNGFDLDLLETVIDHSFDVNNDTVIDEDDFRDWLRVYDYTEFSLEKDDEFGIWHLVELDKADMDEDGSIEGGWSLVEVEVTEENPAGYEFEPYDIELNPEMWADYTTYSENKQEVEQNMAVLDFDFDGVFDKSDADAVMDLMFFIENSTIEIDMENRRIADVATDYDLLNQSFHGRDGVVNADDIAAFLEITDPGRHTDVNRSGAVTDRDVNRIREIIDFLDIKAAWEDWNLGYTQDSPYWVETDLTNRVIHVDGRHFRIIDLSGSYIFEPFYVSEEEIPDTPEPSIASYFDDSTKETKVKVVGTDAEERIYVVSIEDDRVVLRRGTRVAKEQSALSAYMDIADITGDGKVNYIDKNALELIRLDAAAADFKRIDQEMVDTIKEVYSLVSAWAVMLEKEQWQSASLYDQVIAVEGRRLGVEIVNEAGGFYTFYDLDNDNRAYYANAVDSTVQVGSVVYRIIPNVITHDVTLEKLYVKSQVIGTSAISVEGKNLVVSKDTENDVYIFMEGSRIYESQHIGTKYFVVINDAPWEILEVGDGQVSLFKKESMLTASTPVADGTQVVLLDSKLYMVDNSDPDRLVFSDGKNSYTTLKGESTVVIAGKLYRISYDSVTEKADLEEALPGDFDGDGIVTQAEYSTLAEMIGEFTTTQVIDGGEEAAHYVDIGGVRYDIVVKDDGTVEFVERVVRSELVKTIEFNADTYKVTIETATRPEEDNRFERKLLRFTQVSLVDEALQEGASYYSDEDMLEVDLGGTVCGIRWTPEGILELYDPVSPETVLSGDPDFFIVEMVGDTDEEDCLVTSRWLGDGKLDISGLYPAGSRLGESTILVQKQADQFIFIVNAEIDSDALDEILLDAAFYDLDNRDAVKQALMEEFTRATYYYSDTRTDTVDMGGILFNIEEIGAEVRLTARNVTFAESEEAVRQVICRKEGADLVFYGDTGASGPVTQDADGTVLLGNYERYEIEEDALTGEVTLRQISRQAGALGNVRLIEANGVIYGVTETFDGSYTTYTFSDGVHEYTSDYTTQAVRLGEMLFTTSDKLESMTEEEIAEVRGILYDITFDAEGRMKLVKHADKRRPLQIIGLEGEIYAFLTDDRAGKIMMTYPAGIVVAELDAEDDTLELEGRTFDVVRDAYGNVTLDFGGTVTSASMDLLKVNGLRYSVKKTSDTEHLYEFFYQGQITASYSTEEGHKVDLGTGINQLTYDIHEVGGMPRLVEDYMEGTSQEGRFITVEDKNEPYDVIIETGTPTMVTLTDGTNEYIIDTTDLTDTRINLVVDNYSTSREYHVIYDEVSENITLGAVVPSQDGTNDLLASSIKMVIKLGETWYRIIEQKDGSYSFSWTDSEGQPHERYAWLSDGEVKLADEIYFTIQMDDQTGEFTLSQRDYATSLDVEMYPVTGVLPRNVLEIDGTEYILERGVEMQWSDEIRVPEEDEYDFITNTISSVGLTSGYIPVPYFVLKRASDGMEYENRVVTKGVIPGRKPANEISREENRFIIDIPQMSIGLEDYPNLYAPAVELVDTQTGEKRTFFISERFWEEGPSSYYLYSDGEYYATIPRASGDRDDWGFSRADAIVTIEIGGQYVDIAIAEGFDPKDAAELSRGYISESLAQNMRIDDLLESYDDLNINGAWDAGEPYIDENGNGVYDYREPFDDLNSNLGWDPGEPFDDLNGDGEWTDAEMFVDVNVNSMYDAPEPFEDLNNNGTCEYISKYNGRYTTRFVGEYPLSVKSALQVPTVECQIDWVTDELTYASGAYPVRQEITIDGLNYYLYPAAGGAVMLDSVHYESVPAPGGGRRALILGIEEYDGSITVTGAYGLNYAPSPAADGSVVFTDGFNTYTSDPISGTVVTEGRTFRVLMEGDMEEPDWTCSLQEVHPTSIRSGEGMIKVVQTGKDYQVTKLEDGSYTLEDLDTGHQYTSYKSVKVDGTVFEITEDADGITVLQEIKSRREPKNYVEIIDTVAGSEARGGGGYSLINMFADLYGSDIFTEDSYAV
ncbi:MAG: hypothetical protein WBD17_00885, partial [Candidatus Omnitrophota bacterium]